MKPVPIRQQGASTCGQTCVAMAVGASEMAVCDVLNSVRGTTTKHLQKALRHFGVTYERRLRPATKADPMCARFPRAILAARMALTGSTASKRQWHWMLRWDGKIYDPGGAWPGCAGGTRITSALVLTGREGLRW